MSKPVVRPSTPADIAAITDIYGKHVRDGYASFEETPPSEAEMGDRRSAILDRGLPHLVATRDGAVIGFAHLSPYRPRAAYRFSLEDTVYVDADAVRGGVGRALLERLIEQAELGPWRQMVAVIGDSGNAGSIGLHAAMGFQEAGRLSAIGYKHGRWVDVVIMQRAVGDGEGSPPD